MTSRYTTSPVSHGPKQIVAVVLAMLIFMPTMSTAAQLQDNYDVAIKAARAGDTATALILLQALINEFPQTSQYQYDYVTVLGWAGQDQKAYEQHDSLDLTNAPHYVLEALAKSARNIGKHTEAQRLYRAVLEKAPQRVQSRVGLALTMVDAKQGKDALLVLDAAASYQQNNVDIVAAKAYVVAAIRDPIDAALSQEAAVKSGAVPVTALRNSILKLSSSGAPAMALLMAQRNAGAVTDDDLATIKAEQAALHIRWGRYETLNPADRYGHTDMAIETLTQEIAKLSDHRSALAIRMYFDLLLAYRDRQQFDKAIALYDVLVARATVLRPYVLHAVGDIYLAQKQPELALPLLQAALKGEPNNVSIQVSLFYVLLELNRTNEAIAHIDSMAASLPAWIRPLTSQQRIWNPEKLHLDSVSAMARAFSGDLKEGEARLRRLMVQAPNNVDLKSELAHVHLWRGWPRLALSEFREIQALDSEFLAAKLGEVNATYALGDVAGAEALLDQVPPYYAMEPSVLRRAREHETYRLREFTIDISGGEISSYHDSSSDLSVDARYYDLYVGKRWRPFVHLLHQRGDLSGIRIKHSQLGVGLNYGDRSVSGNLELNRHSDDKMGVRLDGRWQINDFLAASAVLDSNSRDTPLRARQDGINASSSEVGLSYRFSELSEASAGFSYQRFNDNNQRTTLYVSARQSLINRPKYSLASTVYFYQQDNKNIDAVYFNPGKLSSIDVGLVNEWRNYQRYARAFKQRLYTSLGMTSQQNYDDGVVWNVRYEHLWDLDDRFYVSYGIGYGTALYDGVSEAAGRASLSINKRF